MAKTYNQKSMRRLLLEHGWTQTLGGKHVVKMTKVGKRPITLPMHKGRDYGPSLAASILRQAGLS
jgi:predicted RNA binding protein YcfA (HicA-like mRNA interferase family)